MVNFSQICLKEDKNSIDNNTKETKEPINENQAPSFSFKTTCSLDILSLMKIDKIKVDECMIGAMKDENNSILPFEDENFEGHKVYRIPTLVVNGSKYKGNWYSHLFFETLCEEYFSHEHDLCLTKNPSKSETGVGAIILIIILVLLILIIVIYLYKKFIERFLDETIAEKIKKQTQGSLGQYHIFKDKENSIVRKGIDVIKN